jgi:hypothetical protein
VVQVQQLFEIIASDAARLGEELLVLALTPLTGRFRHVGREIWVGVEAEPPHLISGLTGFALGSRITDPRLGAPDTSALRADAAPRCWLSSSRAARAAGTTAG